MLVEPELTSRVAGHRQLEPSPILPTGDRPRGNVGSAIGISVTSALLTQNGQIEHSVLSGYITPLNRAFQSAYANLQPTTAHGAQVLNAMMNHQAEIIAYNNDWKLMMLTALPMLLLLFLMRGQKPGAGHGSEHPAVMD